MNELQLIKILDKKKGLKVWQDALIDYFIKNKRQVDISKEYNISKSNFNLKIAKIKKEFKYIITVANS